MERGVVKRWRHRRDARRVTVSITDRGRMLIEPVVRESDVIYATLAVEVGPQRLRQLYEMLDTLIGM